MSLENILFIFVSVVVFFCVIAVVNIIVDAFVDR